jgi:hypothetical protein
LVYFDKKKINFKTMKKRFYWLGFCGTTTQVKERFSKMINLRVSGITYGIARLIDHKSHKLIQKVKIPG